nr:MAG TPA: hypothetical protein [Caudoviricetes sp.]
MDPEECGIDWRQKMKANRKAGLCKGRENL